MFLPYHPHPFRPSGKFCPPLEKKSADPLVQICETLLKIDSWIQDAKMCTGGIVWMWKKGEDGLKLCLTRQERESSCRLRPHQLFIGQNKTCAHAPFSMNLLSFSSWKSLIILSQWIKWPRLWIMEHIFEWICHNYGFA